MLKKIRVVLLLGLLAALGITIYKWWDSDSGYKYLKQKQFDESVKQECVKKDKVNFSKLLQKNDEVVAWIKIKGSPVDYPILLHSNNDYYLNHNVYNEYSVSGSLFLDKSYYVEDKILENPFLYNHYSCLLVYLNRHYPCSQKIRR